MSRFEILYRRLDAPVASWSAPGVRWAVEYWCDEMAYPVAQAWVNVSPYGEHIDWLHVQEAHRGRGVGFALLCAVSDRWPGVKSYAATEAGARLQESHRRRRARS